MQETVIRLSFSQTVDTHTVIYDLIVENCCHNTLHERI